MSFPPSLPLSPFHLYPAPPRLPVGRCQQSVRPSDWTMYTDEAGWGYRVTAAAAGAREGTGPHLPLIRLTQLSPDF